MKKQKQYLVALHILFWIIDVTIELVFFSSNGINYYSFGGTYLLMFVLFYFNYFFLTRIFTRHEGNKYYLLWFISYFTVFIVMYNGWIPVRDLLLDIHSSWSSSYFLLFSISIVILYGSVSTGLRLAWDWFENVERQQVLVTQKTKTQIQLMKANVNLPFMLYTLDVLEKQARINPESIEHHIVNLSNVLRYGLYESQCESIILEKEVEILADYISLLNETQQNFHIQLAIKTDGSASLPPNLLVKFTALWVEEIGKKQNDPKPVVAEIRSSDEIKYTLPVFKEGEKFIKVVNEKLPDFTNTSFKVNYALNENSVCLQIVTIA